MAPVFKCKINFTSNIFFRYFSFNHKVIAITGNYQRLPSNKQKMH